MTLATGQKKTIQIKVAPITIGRRLLEALQFLFLDINTAFKWQQNAYVSLRLRVQNAVPAQPSVGKLGISLVLLNFLHCNFRLWFKTT